MPYGDQSYVIDGNAARVRVWGKADEYLCKCASLSLRAVCGVYTHTLVGGQNLLADLLPAFRQPPFHIVAALGHDAAATGQRAVTAWLGKTTAARTDPSEASLALGFVSSLASTRPHHTAACGMGLTVWEQPATPQKTRVLVPSGTEALHGRCLLTAISPALTPKSTTDFSVCGAAAIVVNVVEDTVMPGGAATVVLSPATDMDEPVEAAAKRPRLAEPGAEGGPASAPSASGGCALGSGRWWTELRPPRPPDHPTVANPPPKKGISLAAVAAPLDPDGNVLLTRRAPHMRTFPGCWYTHSSQHKAFRIRYTCMACDSREMSKLACLRCLGL